MDGLAWVPEDCITPSPREDRIGAFIRGARRISHWVEYFPGHHMWSQSMMFGIEMQTWGAAALGEIDQVGQKLMAHVGDNEKWWGEWTAMAKRIEGFGEAAEAEG